MCPDAGDVTRSPDRERGTQAGHELTVTDPGAVTVGLRLADVSVAGHVGNTALLQLIDEARMSFLVHPLPKKQRNAQGPLENLPCTVRRVIAQQTLEYLRELSYSRDPVTVKSSVTYIGTSSFCVASTLLDGHGDPVVRAEATYVLLHGPESLPWQMSAEVRELLSRHMAEPPHFRPRPSIR